MTSSGGLAAVRTNVLLADQFLELTQLLLNFTSHFFGPAFRLKIGIVNELALSLFRRSFCVAQVAFNLLPCAVCHLFSPMTCCLSNAVHVRPKGLHVGDQTKTLSRPVPGRSISFLPSGFHGPPERDAQELRRAAAEQGGRRAQDARLPEQRERRERAEQLVQDAQLPDSVGRRPPAALARRRGSLRPEPHDSPAD